MQMFRRLGVPSTLSINVGILAIAPILHRVSAAPDTSPEAAETLPVWLWLSGCSWQGLLGVTRYFVRFSLQER